MLSIMYYITIILLLFYCQNSPICDSTLEKGLSRAKYNFPVEVKISNAVIRCQNSFYFSISIFSMSPTFRRAVRVQKCLFVPERVDLKELLKLRTNACLFTKLLFMANYVETITCATYGHFRNLIFNLWKRVSRVQQLFVCDRLPCITLARNALWKWGNGHLEA